MSVHLLMGCDHPGCTAQIGPLLFVPSANADDDDCAPRKMAQAIGWSKVTIHPKGFAPVVYDYCKAHASTATTRFLRGGL